MSVLRCMEYQFNSTLTIECTPTITEWGVWSLRRLPKRVELQAVVESKPSASASKLWDIPPPSFEAKMCFLIHQYFLNPVALMKVYSQMRSGINQEQFMVVKKNNPPKLSAGSASRRGCQRRRNVLEVVLLCALLLLQ